jgi:uncharacterized membrane protein
MMFFAVLAIATILAAATQVVLRRLDVRSSARIGMAAAMIFAGVAHLLMPTPFLQHLPAWTPFAEAIIFLTGLIEIGFGAVLLMLRPPWRRRTGLALAAYLVAIFPGNLYVAVTGIDVDGQPGGWYPWLRLPVQAVLIAWALWSTRSAAGAPARQNTTAHPAPATAAH